MRFKKYLFRLGKTINVDNGITCDICGSNNVRVVYSTHRRKCDKGTFCYTVSDAMPKKPDKIVKCTVCGLMFAPKSPDENSKILKDYENYVDEDYVKEQKGRRMTARILLERIESFAERGKMLDIGCAGGFFLDEAQKKGWEVYGIEPSKWARKYAEEKRGIKILSSMLEESKFEKESFDVVVMLDVLEHLSSPRQTLLMVNKILKKNGLLVVSTPDVESFLSHLLRARWWGINRYHLFYFSKKTLENLFKESNFKTMCYKSHARIFTLKYWFTRISYYSPLLRLLSKPFFWLRKFDSLNIKLSLYDQIEVYAVKTQ